MIRTVNVKELTKNIKEMCIEATHFLSADMDEAMKKAAENEESALGHQILSASGKSADCRGRYDSDLPGHRYGCDFPGSGSGVSILRAEMWKMLSMKAYVRDIQKDF